jgi:hypothetical protein
MHFWSTGVFYIFRDCLGLFGRIANPTSAVWEGPKNNFRGEGLTEAVRLRGEVLFLGV